MKRIIFVLVLLALGTGVASAQNIVNPRQVQFTSEDHALAIRYELGYYLPGATDPAQIVPVPIAQVTGTGTYSILMSKPLLGANLLLKVRLVATAAAGGEVMSPWSDPSDPFDLTPLAPGGLVVK